MLHTSRLSTHALHALHACVLVAVAFAWLGSVEASSQPLVDVMHVAQRDDPAPPFANREHLNWLCGQNRCDQCLSKPECGWCTSTWTCMHGNATGPQAVAYATTPVPCPNATTSWVYSGGDVSACVPGVTQVAQPDATPAVPLELDVICVNGGQRSYKYVDGVWTGNTFCDCPAGWGGVDCASCLTQDVCLVPGQGGNHSCVNALVPLGPPLSVNQRFSCSCAGVASTLLCEFLSGGSTDTRIVLDIQWDNRTASTTIFTPSPRATPNIYYSTINFAFNFTDCVVNPDIGACPSGPEYNWQEGNEPCMELTCKTSANTVPYPEHPVPACTSKHHPCYPSSFGTCKKCVDYKCWDRSWRYKECSDALESVETAYFTCQYDRSNASHVYQCAFKTTGFGPIALQCDTGACLDNAPPQPPTPPLIKPPALSVADWDAIILAVPALLTCVLSACCGHVLWQRRAELQLLARGSAQRRGTAEAKAKGDLGRAGAAARPRSSDARRKPGDRAPLLHVSELGLAYSAASSAAFRALPLAPRLSFHHLTYSVQRTRWSTPRPILRGVSGLVPSGTLFALLGPSGAGKTTMLDILAGRKSTAGGVWGGVVRINGVRLAPEELRQCIGYVTQDDVGMGTQSVREYMLWQTRMRLPAHLTQTQRHQRVNHVLTELDLQRVASSPIGDSFVRGLSGGEKRRLSIAAELITDPAVLIVDEPTSGLDSANAKSVVDALVRVARAGRVVVMSIHQPRSYIWSQFDRLMLLGQRGEVVYQGTRADCLPFFDRHGHRPDTAYNPADFLLDTVAALSRDEAVQLEAACQAGNGAVSSSDGGVGARAGATAGQLNGSHASAGDTDATPASRDAVLEAFRRHRAGFWRSLWEISLRTLTNIVRNPYLLALNYAATITIGLLTGLVFTHLPFNFDGLQDRLGLFFFSFLYFSMTSISSLGIWREERLLFLRERASNTYTTAPYFVAKVACDILPLRALPPIIFSALVYWNAGLHDGAINFLVFATVITLVNIASATLCLAVGALVRNMCLANLVAALCLLYALLLCGLLSHNAAAGSAMNAFERLSFMNYAFEILGNNEFLGQTYNLSPNLPNHKIVPAFPATGATVVLTLGLKLDMFKLDFTGLGLFTVLFLLCVYAILRFGVKEQR